ncbi:restriction endonuclease subunit S [Alcanivorax sp.]|jgi:type I restriction enzyme S subunit|uniref:restriction endonuclease subunit S n=1 Tax=Alcanivorax sp. TaxID=1872427 RepID=UPI0032D90A99
MQLATYSNLRDSNVPWIQSIPSHWTIKRLKFVVELVNQKQSVDQSDLPYIGLEHIESWTGRKVDGEISQSEGLASTYASGDVLFGKLRPYLAKIYLADTPGLVSSEALVIRPSSDISSSFLKYYFLSRDFINTVDSSTYGSKMPRASWDYIGNLPLLIPSAQEQQAIVGFLDRKTAQIDALIAKKQALLEKLAEQRTALISQAVTKGLDSSVPMKNSGVDWLGEIPSHWRYKRLKFLVSVLGGGTPNTSKPEYWNGDIPWVSPKDMKHDFINTTEDYLTEKGVEESATRLIKSNAVLIVVRSGILRHTIPVARNTCLVSLNQDMKALITNTELNSGYLHWFINGLQKGLLPLWSKPGCTVESLELNYLLNTLIPLPPHSEQQKIEDYVANIRDDFNNRLAKVAEVIQRLQEYRAALITNAVTGKIDVRSFCTPTTSEQKELAHG